MARAVEMAVVVTGEARAAATAAVDLVVVRAAVAKAVAMAVVARAGATVAGAMGGAAMAGATAADQTPRPHSSARRTASHQPSS